ncbi:MAG: DMT family transporter [Deferribacteraceae bacterium]|nr:DMT family transporter [Deferribacteraceae bacterium]
MKRGVAAGVLSGVFWGIVFLIPAVLHEFSPFIIVVIRYSFYGILCFGAIFFVRSLSGRKAYAQFSNLDGKQRLVMVKLVFFGNIFYYLAVTGAVQLIGIAAVSLIEGLVPVMAVLFGRSPGVSLKRLSYPLILIILGLIAINTDLFTALPDKTLADKAIGVLLAFLALFSWSYYAIVNARSLQLYSNFTPSEWSSLFGAVTGIFAAIIGAAAFLLLGGNIPSKFIQGDLSLLLTMTAVLAIFPSFMGTICWNAASKKLPVSLSGQMIVFETIFALIYGFIYYARFPRLLETAAIVLMAAGVVWSIRLHRRY